MAQPQPNLVEVKSLTNTANSIQLGSSQGNYTPGVIAMSMGGTLYESLSLMASYDMTIQQQYLEYQQDLAKANVGIVNNYLTTSIDAANEQAQATRNQAYGELASGCIGLATFGASTGAILKSGDPVTQSKLEDAQSFQKELNARPAKLDLQLHDVSETEVESLKAAQGRAEAEVNRLNGEVTRTQHDKDIADQNVVQANAEITRTEGEAKVAADEVSKQQGLVDEAKGEKLVANNGLNAAKGAARAAETANNSANAHADELNISATQAEEITVRTSPEHENFANLQVVALESRISANDAFATAKATAETKNAADAKVADLDIRVTRADVQVATTERDLANANVVAKTTEETAIYAKNGKFRAVSEAARTGHIAENTADEKVLAESRAAKASELVQTAEKTVAINNKIKGWASGDKSTLANFTNEADKELNEKAVNQVQGRPSEYDTVRKNVSDMISELQKTLEQSSTKLNTFTNTANMVENGAQGITKGAAGTYQATEQQKSQSDAARADVIKSLEGQWNGNMNNAQQSANQFAQSAMQAAAAFGTISQTKA